MIDLHFHLLPGVDDGPATTLEAVDLARAAVAAGTDTVVATPHVSWRWPQNDALRIANGVMLLKRELRAAGVALDVRRGAEVALADAVDLPAGDLARLGLAGGPWLLLECPSQGAAAGVEILIGSLPVEPGRVLLAHPERIRTFREEPELLARLVAAGARCQITASALTGGFGRDVERFSLWLLEQGLVHVAASDAHAVSGRPPSLAKALRRAGVSDAVAQWLTQECPAAVLAGESLPPAPTRQARHGARRPAR